MEVCLSVKIIFSVAVAGAVSLLIHVYRKYYLQAERLRRKLLMQGIKGPVPSFLFGNLHEMQEIQKKVATKSSSQSDILAHDYTETLFPYLEHWRKEYGRVYTYSTGTRIHMYVGNPELVREINQCVTLDLGKPAYLTKRLAPMLGNGILKSNGHLWAQQRQIIAPEFFMEKVKAMTGLMVSSTVPIISNWENYIEIQGGAADIRVDEDFRKLAADVIARACFGSSYTKGKDIFEKLTSIQKLISEQSTVYVFSNFGVLSKKNKRMISNLEKEVESLIWETVRERQELCATTSSIEKDLMQSILEGAINDESMDNNSSKRFIVDNCKNMYFAGHETVAITASWIMMLLALHPEWQARVRDEVDRVLKGTLPDAESVSQLKIMSMVIQETLRLYPPGVFVTREALEDLKLGSLTIPKGVCMWTCIPTMHRDTEIWGPDANEFKPQRFSNGVSGACKTPHAYIPFGAGARLCLGKTFALVQLKVILSLIIPRFTFTLSPKYRHCPRYNMVVGPGHGLHIIVQKISSEKHDQN